MKKLLLFGFIFGFFGFMVSCDFFGSNTTTVITTTTEETTLQTTTEPVETTEPLTTIESDLTIQLRHIYQLSLEADTFDGTYEEWLDTVEGPQGEPGREVIISVEDEHIKWKYVDDSTWTDLIPLVDLTGEQGVGIESTTINEFGELIITYTDASEANIGIIVSRFQVNFIDYNGYLLDTFIVEYGGSVESLVQPYREGYIFAGWSETDLTSITSNINVYAQYDINEYTVSFNSDGGTIISEMTNIEYGSTILLPIPEKVGYEFNGWFRGITVNDTQFTSEDVVAGNITLYAEWIVKLSEELNEPPVIEGLTYVSVFINSNYDPLDGVIATDKEDGDITESIVIIGFDDTAIGTYTFTYNVTDSNGNTVTATREFTFTDPGLPPEISGLSPISIPVGSEFDELVGVTALDEEDGDITGLIVVQEYENRVVGIIPITYVIEDSDGNSVSSIRMVEFFEPLKSVNIMKNLNPVPFDEMVGVFYDEDNNSVDIIYKILEVDGGIIEQLTTWVTSDTSKIEVTSGLSTAETITQGISVSLSVTFGVEAKFLKAETTLGFEASLSKSVTQEHSKSVALTFNLDEYEEGLNYAVFLTGTYAVYQVFSTNIETGVVTEYFVFRIISPPITRLVSSVDTNLDNYIDASKYRKTSFDPDNYFGGGKGTAEEPYEIFDESGLFAIYLCTDAHYILTDNIYLENFKGLNTTTFSGVLDGQGHFISGLDILIEIPEAGIAEEKGYGLFKCLDGEIKNLKFKNAKISLPYESHVHNGDGFLNVGILAGSATENSIINNVIVEDSIINISRFNSKAGGLIGDLNGGTIMHSKVLTTTVSSCGYVGGIVGYMSNKSLVTYSVFKGIESEYGVISLYSTGTRRGSGGIAGVCDNSTISYSTVKYVEFKIDGNKKLYPPQAAIAGTLSNATVISTFFEDINKTNNIGDWYGGFWGNIYYGEYYFPTAHAYYGWGLGTSDLRMRYTVWYMDYDGTTILLSKVYLPGETIDSENDVSPLRSGYLFENFGETIPATMPGNDLILSASYIIQEGYYIEFLDYDESILSTVTISLPCIIDEDPSYLHPSDPTRVGYTFTGWDKEIISGILSGSQSITAQYEANDVTITFVTNGGTIVNSITQKYGTKIVLPESPTFVVTPGGTTEQVFNGWYLDAELTQPFTLAMMPLENFTLYAGWHIIAGPGLT